MQLLFETFFSISIRLFNKVYGHSNEKKQIKCQHNPQQVSKFILSKEKLNLNFWLKVF